MPIVLHPSMLDKIIIIDFEDSFTYNIASMLFPFQKNLKVINHKDFFLDKINLLLESEERISIILGPGPGHPKEFTHYFKSIEQLRNRRNVYLMGICLGHQVLGLMDELTVADSHFKVHGQTEQVSYKGLYYTVQRYNSLSVFENELEAMIRYFPRGVSYQFHPESIGTENNLVFFHELLEFIKDN